MKANRPYKRVNGEEVTLSYREMKTYIMKVHKWSESEYNRQRYLMKNKLRTYEAFQKIDPANAQSPVNVMYFQAKSMAEARRHGEVYEPSLEMKRLQAFAGLGSKRQIEKALSNEKLMEKWGRAYEETTYKTFAGMIEKLPKAREIYKSITDPVQREKALIAYAEKLKLTEKEKKEALKQGVPIPSGPVAGYGDFDFDYSDYLD